MTHTFKHLGHKIIKGPKVVDESKIVDVPTPPGFVERRMTLSAIKKYGGSKIAKAKGGAIKKKKKFPDLSGDGKVTKKDILMAKGIIKKKPKKKR